MVCRLHYACLLILVAICPVAAQAQEKAVPAELLKAVKDASPDLRIKAIMGLSKLGVEAVPVLLEATKDNEANVAAAAEFALGLIKLEPAAYLATLKPFVADKTKSVREGVAVGLGRCGPDAIEPLVVLVGDESVDVRKKAVGALQVIARKNVKEAARIVPGLEKALKDEEASVRLAAVQTLPRAGPTALPVILKALEDSDPKVRAFASAALTHYKAELPAVVPQLAKRFQVEQESIVKQSLLQTITKVGSSATPFLIDALKDKSLEVRKAALASLGKIGMEAKAALPNVKEMAAQSTHPDLRKTAVGVLSQFGPEGRAAIIELLAVDDPDTRTACLIYFAKQKAPAPASAVPRLLPSLDSKEREIRALAIRVLGNIGPDAKEALPALTRAETDPDEQIRKEAERAVKNIEGK